MNDTQPSLIRYEYHGSMITIGQSQSGDLWRAALNGVFIPNGFFKSFQQADAHCKALVDILRGDIK